MQEQTSGTWEGGYWRLDGRGRRVYVIRRQVAGKRYEVSTRARNEPAAVAQLRRFEADPEGYDPRGRVRPNPIYLDVKLADAFLAWSAKPKAEGGRGNTGRWVHEQKLYLDWWAERLKGVDLRRLSYEEHVTPAMETAKSQRQRGATLLALYRYLRKERGLPLTEDPVHGRLTFGEPEPEQLKRSKVVPPEHIDLVIEHLTSPWRDALTIQGGDRVARDGGGAVRGRGYHRAAPEERAAGGRRGRARVPASQVGRPAPHAGLGGRSRSREAAPLARFVCDGAQGEGRDGVQPGDSSRVRRGEAAGRRGGDPVVHRGDDPSLRRHARGQRLRIRPGGRGVPRASDQEDDGAVLLYVRVRGEGTDAALTGRG